jgi:hypothetical protein
MVPRVWLNDKECLESTVVSSSVVTCTTAASAPGHAKLRLQLAGINALDRSASHADSAASGARQLQYNFDACTNVTQVFNGSHTQENAYCAPQMCSYVVHDLGQMTLSFHNTHFKLPLHHAELMLEAVLDDRSPKPVDEYTIDVELNGHNVIFNRALLGLGHGKGDYTVYNTAKTFTNFGTFVLVLDAKHRALLKNDGDNTFLVTLHSGWYGFVVLKKAELRVCS